MNWKLYFLTQWIQGKELIDHSKGDHKVQMKEEKLTFGTYGEFLKWKKQVEKLTNTSYVQRTSCHIRIGVCLYYSLIWKI